MKSKTVLVVGATGGMGSAICKQLQKDGLTVIGVGRNEENLRSLGLTTYFICDLTDPKKVQSVFNEIKTQFPSFDILIHVAGVIYTDEQVTMNPLVENEMDQVNYKTVKDSIEILLPALIKTKGLMVIINSTAGLSARPGFISYSNTKIRLKEYTDSLRIRLKNTGIRITNLFPGSTATAMQMQVAKHKNIPYVPENLIQPNDIAILILSLIRLSSSSETEDIVIKPKRQR